jgi:membrane protein DedA with SNARE-associated domain/pimeloyl-ACP methyl ester carboxylesterase
VKLIPASWVGRILLAYLVLLAASHLVIAGSDFRPELDEADRVVELPVIEDSERLERKTRVVYRDTPASARASAEPRPAIVLLHGSPGSLYDFVRLQEHLGDEHRIVSLDLPGMGKSVGHERLPDYSVDAHAWYTLALLDELGIERAHLVGFSMGGGVAIRMAALAPGRAASVTLVSGLGVQEHELFGDHQLNHLVHGFQLGVIRGAQLLLPHFGRLEHNFLGYGYARNFFDTDQRPLRDDLAEYEGPMLIQHGRRDFLVPVGAALEHERIVPQSELVLYEGSHFLVFRDDGLLAEDLLGFWERVESGQATLRSTAGPERVRVAADPFDPASVPAAAGLALAILMLLIIFATFVSEDLTCIGVGLLIADGRLGFLPGTLACIAGIFIGDVGVYCEGRFLGRPAVQYPPLRWIVTPARLERARRWFDKHGRVTLLASRFIPGARLTTYLAAGMAHVPFLFFASFLFLGALVWTPILVGLAMFVGVEARELFARFEEHALLALVLVALVLLMVQRIGMRLLTAHGRRYLLGSWRRLVRWEFWPLWVLYAPVVVYVAWLALKHRSLAVMTATNPAIPGGGFVGESKSAILDGLADAPDLVARHLFLRAADPVEQRREATRTFLNEHGLTLPVVLKPDAGQRGSGVWIVQDEEELERRLDELKVDSLLQEYVPGIEFGLFYARRASEAQGRLISITEKVRPTVTGDGTRTLEDLILFDDRAVCLARTYLDLNAARLDDVPAADEQVTIAELGTHCRGAIFLDGERVHSTELTASVERLSRALPGFHFGRYDVRTESVKALMAGRFKAVELNGLTSESTHIYDPRHTLFGAWRTLCRQWELAFEIGAENRAQGASTTSAAELVGQWLGYRKLERGHATR